MRIACSPGDRRPQSSPATAALLALAVAPAPSGRTGAEIAAHLVGEMAGEGARILEEGIARGPADIDLVEIRGYGFPRRRGGPMFHAIRSGD